MAVAAIFLVQGLRSSLLEQLDDSISDQVVDLAVNITDFETLSSATALNDIDTLQVIIAEADPDVYLANDLGIQGSEILDEIPLQDSLLDLDPIIVDASLTTATDTPGSNKMRVAFAPLILDDQPLDDPVIYALVGRVVGPIDDTVAATQNRLLIVFPLVVAGVALLAWWITGRALRPVDIMRREVDEISATDLERRVSEAGSSAEIDQLATTMNRMLDRLQSSATRQQQFVSDAAHELRTPLASVAAQLDVDAAHPDAADQVATAAAVRGEVTRMQTMIDSMLVLARSDQGAQPHVSKLLDLDEVARVAAGRVPKPAHIALDVSAVMPAEARGDEAALLRIADNLLANAYRHAASAVHLASGEDVDGVWLTVDDDGDGVPAASREAVFERFVRLDEARTRDAGGSGLGLALAREIATGHGGNLFAMDSSLGGARFVLRLPPAR